MSYDPDKLRAALGQMVLDNSGLTWPMHELAREIKNLEHEQECYHEAAADLKFECDDLKRRLTNALKEIDRLQSIMLPAVIREVHP